MKNKTPDHPWDLMSAINLIRYLDPKARELGFALGLTGSVLFKGYSANDLDIVAYPMESVDSDYAPVVQLFLDFKQGSSALAVTRGRNADSKLVFALKMPDGKRIELFFPSRKLGSRQDAFGSFEEKTDYR